MSQKVGIVGAGAWGTALALAARRADREVVLWSHRADQVAAIRAAGENTEYLPGVPLDEGIRVTNDMTELHSTWPLLLVVPAQILRDVTHTLSLRIDRSTPLVICAKGIERGSGLRLSQVVGEAARGFQSAVLSGPSFATEVAAGLPTAVTIGANDVRLAEKITGVLGSRSFRPYPSDDPIGVELGGAAKNVLAIAVGIAVGAKLGENARAALITRGLAELTRFGLALGGRAATLAGLSGMGDLVLTCSSTQSRNLSLGIELGRGARLEDILKRRHTVVEGVETAAALASLANRAAIEMPIAAAVDRVLHHGLAVDKAIEGLLTRPFRPETSAG